MQKERLGIDTYVSKHYQPTNPSCESSINGCSEKALWVEWTDLMLYGLIWLSKVIVTSISNPGGAGSRPLEFQGLQDL